MADDVLLRDVREFVEDEMNQRGGADHLYVGARNARALLARIDAALAAAPSAPDQEAKPVGYRWRAPDDDGWQWSDTADLRARGLPPSAVARAIVEPLYAQPAQETMTRASIWLIEWPDDGNLHPLRWWHGEFGYTRDPNKTPRFARREDAEMAIKYLKLDGATAVEHIWMDSDVTRSALAALEPRP